MLQCWVIWSCTGNHSYSEFMSAIASSCHRRQHFTASLISAFRLNSLQFPKSSMLYASVFLYIFLLYYLTLYSIFLKHSQSMRIYVCVYLHMYRCIGRPEVENENLLDFSPSYSLKQSLSVDPELRVTTSVGNQLALGIFCLSAFWFLELYVDHPVYLAFMWANGIWTPILTFKQQTLPTEQPP